MNAFLLDAATLASASVRAQALKKAAPQVSFSDTSTIKTPYTESTVARKKKSGLMLLAPVAALGALAFGFLLLKK